jgi:alpha-ketoglutaric semialdehyde dehydrogenase
MVHSNIEKQYQEKLKELSDEVFGPFTLVVSCKTAEELIEVVNALPGQLTATILGTSSDLVSSKKLSTRLQLKTGRLLFKGVPTGVAVIQAMQHGGPYPASTDPRFTAVGTDAIYRWLQPVAFQDCPQDLLPEALRNENPLGLLRSINGELTTEAL